MVITSIRNESLKKVSDTTVGTNNFKEQVCELLWWAGCSEMFRCNISNHGCSSLQNLFAITDSYLPIILKNRVTCINKVEIVLERSLEIGSSDNTVEILKTIFQYILAVSRMPICKTMHTMFCSTRIKWSLQTPCPKS